MPGDPTFNQYNTSNPYDEASYDRICDEFRIKPSSNFRFTHRKNHGLESVYIGASGHGAMKTGTSYPGFNKFSDEGGAATKENWISNIQPGVIASTQYDWFADWFDAGGAFTC